MKEAAMSTISRAALVACALFAPVAWASSPVAVNIDRFAFTPAEITVSPGTKVVWTNHDQTPHTVTSNDKVFASKGLDTDDKFEFTFTRAGDFAYLCTLHPHMTGVVHVR